MRPRQILGSRCTAADTYSLGVMLFELLVALSLPPRTRLARGAGGDRQRRSASAERVTTDKLLRVRCGDLDAIILKALSKQAEQRYETAAAFADDLERWLDQRPVRAQRSSGWYRVRRFLVRHRFRVIAGTAAISALLVGGGAVLWQRHIAGEEAARASSVRNFVLIIAQADHHRRRACDADLALLTTAEPAGERTRHARNWRSGTRARSVPKPRRYAR
jgi:serine/threonine-protein kinase